MNSERGFISPDFLQERNTPYLVSLFRDIVKQEGGDVLARFAHLDDAEAFRNRKAKQYGLARKAFGIYKVVYIANRLDRRDPQ